MLWKPLGFLYLKCVRKAVGFWYTGSYLYITLYRESIQHAVVSGILCVVCPCSGPSEVIWVINGPLCCPQQQFVLMVSFKWTRSLCIAMKEVLGRQAVLPRWGMVIWAIRLIHLETSWCRSHWDCWPGNIIKSTVWQCPSKRDLSTILSFRRQHLFWRL